MITGHEFHGGLHLPNHKERIRDQATLPPFIPDRLVFPLIQHTGTESDPIVAPGDRVLKGEVIARSGSYVSSTLHASSSGVVEHIGVYPVASGEHERCIIIRTDGDDRWGQEMEALDYLTVSPEVLERRIEEAGIVGMGGAGFPSHVKVIEGADEQVETLIINGVECEPYICCDDRLMCERTEEVVLGAKILQKIVNARQTLLAVEEDMSEAYEALINIADNELEIVKVPEIYPAGGERQLIRTLIGQQVPPHALPIEIGVLMLNVATVAAIYRAVVKGKPLISRIVTVVDAEDRGINIEVLNGTPVDALLRHLKMTVGPDQKLLFGGPMMGREVFTKDAPVLRKTNCVLIRKREPEGMETTCIRCGDCIDVCPEEIQPQMLMEFGRSQAIEQLKEYRIFSCIECACCNVVCPSHIPLVRYFQHAKEIIIEQEEAKSRAVISRRRYESRLQRLKREAKRKREGQNKNSVEEANREKLKAAVQASIQRAKSKRKNQNRIRGNS